MSYRPVRPLHRHFPVRLCSIYYDFELCSGERLLKFIALKHFSCLFCTTSAFFIFMQKYTLLQWYKVLWDNDDELFFANFDKLLNNPKAYENMSRVHPFDPVYFVINQFEWYKDIETFSLKHLSLNDLFRVCQTNLVHNKDENKY